MKRERESWETRYRSGLRPHDGPPSSLLRRWLPHLPRGRALDVATGLGRNALYLAKAGYTVDAIDVSPTGLEIAAARARRRRLRVRWIEADLDAYPLPRSRYAVVVNAYFLKRGLWPALKASVRPGGVLIFETHLESPTADGGPRRRSRLRRGELRKRFAKWDVLDLEEGTFHEGGRAWLIGRIVARRPR